MTSSMYQPASSKRSSSSLTKPNAMITERPKAAGGSSAELELEKAVRGFREPMPDEVGPSYWGIGGINAWDWAAFKGDPQSERTVTVGNAAGRRFQGTHGRGTLILPKDWPQADAVGSGMRCTHYDPPVGRLDHNWSLQRPRLSDRLLAAVADPERNPSHKWRGVRTAPREAAAPPP